MPSLFQGVCRRCGYKTPVLTEGYFAVLVDEPQSEKQHEVAGAVITDGEGGAMAVAGDPRFVVLRHPIESSDLAGTGYTWSDLLWEGRYIEVTNVVCGQCGTVFQHRRLVAPGQTGCMAALVLGLVTGLSVGIWQHSILLGLFACGRLAVSIGMVTDLLERLYLRRHFSKRNATLAAERACPKCHAEDANAVGHGRRVTCPACSTKAMRFVIVGIS